VLEAMENQDLDLDEAIASVLEAGTSTTLGAQDASSESMQRLEAKKVQSAESWVALQQKRLLAQRCSAGTFFEALTGIMNAKKGTRKNPYPSMEKRSQSVVRVGARPILMPDKNLQIAEDELATYSYQDQVKFFSKMAQRFPDAYSEAANAPANAASLKAVTVKLNVQSAADLWLSTFLKHDQWNKVAHAFNSRMAPGEILKGASSRAPTPSFPTSRSVEPFRRLKMCRLSWQRSCVAWRWWI
jgi:hypothetical protein